MQQGNEQSNIFSLSYNKSYYKNFLIWRPIQIYRPNSNLETLNYLLAWVIDELINMIMIQINHYYYLLILLPSI